MNAAKCMTASGLNSFTVLVEQLCISQIADNQFSVKNGIPVAFRKVIVDQNRKTLLTQGLDYMASDIAGTACDKYVSPLKEPLYSNSITLLFLHCPESWYHEPGYKSNRIPHFMSTSNCRGILCGLHYPNKMYGIIKRFKDVYVRVTVRNRLITLKASSTEVVNGLIYF